jgi:hypothetical protein
MKTFPLVGAIALMAVAVSGCGTTGVTLPGAPGGQQQFLDNLGKFNAAAAQNCTGGGDFIWSPPLPPTGNVHLHCELGKAPAAAAAASPAS